MNAELQSRCWACLPKEARQKIKERYEGWNRVIGFETECILYDDLFGHHNLTSDTEPEEMLMILRKEVQKLYRTLELERRNVDFGLQDKILYDGKLDMLDELFGDKCLPDKPSVQDEPRFKVGDIVRVKYIPIYEGEIGIIDEIGSRILEYHLKGNKTLENDWFAESYLESYTEPEIKSLKVGDKVRVKGEDKVREVYRIFPDGYVMFGDKGNAYSVDELELVEPETKDNMEEKELNLCELLKGCEGETLYSRAYGEVSLNEIVRDNRPNAQEIKVYTPDPQSDRIWFLRNGRKHKNGEIDLWPSRTLYEKYPLDPYSAWMEWKEERKPKRWRAKQYQNYWYFDRRFIPKECTADANSDFDETNYKNGNYFRTEEEAQQAAEAVRETLMKFHELNHKQ